MALSIGTITVPLTTIFTPPASCSTHWTYEASFYNSFQNGLLLQNAIQSSIDTDCFPSGFIGYGMLNTIEVYSPGYCPVGYSTPAIYKDSGTTTAICCPR
jgi:hypothetical protein